MKPTEFIECRICGKILRFVGTHLYYAHSMTAKEYRRQFPGAQTTSDVTRQKFCKAQKGRIVSAETCRKLSEAKKGKVPIWYFDEEKRKAAYAKVAKSSAGRTPSENTRRAVAESNRRREWTPEMRERSSRSHKARWAVTDHPRLGLKYKMTEKHRVAISKARAGQIQRGEVAWKTGYYKSSIAGEVYYQSSYELRFMKVLDTLGWLWERCSESFQWIDTNGKSHLAIPDFKVQRPTGKPVYYDTKGYFSDKDQYKQKQLQEQIPLIILTGTLLETHERLIQ